MCCVHITVYIVCKYEANVYVRVYVPGPGHTDYLGYLGGIYMVLTRKYFYLTWIRNIQALRAPISYIKDQYTLIKQSLIFSDLTVNFLKLNIFDSEYYKVNSLAPLTAGSRIIEY